MVARLHHERISRAATRWLVMTHGIFGAGSNWRGIARKLVERRPEWGVVLVDLRQHGRSEPGEPPHDLAACARDLQALVEELGGVEALAGHSFGGKVVLATRAIAPPTLRQTWLLDSSPSARPGAAADPANTVTSVLALLERLPRTWSKREEFVAAIIADDHPLAFAQWLATNVVPDAHGVLALRLDLGAIREMLADYYARDLWDIALAPSPGDVELVIADRSRAASDADRRGLPPHVHVHHVAADHWLHIDAPGEVVELFGRRLP